MEGLRQLLDAARENVLPDVDTIRLAIKLTAATASGSFTYFSAEQHQANREPGEEDISGTFETSTFSFINFLEYFD